LLKRKIAWRVISKRLILKNMARPRVGVRDKRYGANWLLVEHAAGITKDLFFIYRPHARHGKLKNLIA
jgi:hypothetical protein